MKFKTPWYKNIPTIVSILALLFSFSTTFVSYYKSSISERQDAVAEFRGLATRLGSLPRESFELYQRYKNEDAFTIGQLSTFIKQESEILLSRATSLLEKYPNDFSASEYLAISYASGENIHDVLRYATKAAERAVTLNDAVVAYRSLGQAHLRLGNIDTGRSFYQKAKDIFVEERFQKIDMNTKNVYHLMTELYWAQVELFIAQDANEAKRHVEECKKYHAKLLNPAINTNDLKDNDQFLEQLNKLDEFIANAQQNKSSTTIPTPLTK